MADFSDDKVNRIFLWINPRNLSTAFTKCVSFMDGACIWHEPYVSSFFKEMFLDPEMIRKYPQLSTFKTQFSETSDQLESFDHYFDGGNLKPLSEFDYDWTQEQLSKPLPSGKKFLFVKDGAMCIINRLDKLPKVPFKHTFLIRDPLRSAESNRRLFMSFWRYDGKPEDFDMYHQNPYLDLDLLPPNPSYEVWRYVKANIDPNPVVIDADDLQTFPEQILRKYCEAVNIPFKKSYVNWEESDKSLKYYNGCVDQMVLGKKIHAYDAAFASTCFKPITSPKPRFDDLTLDGQRFVRENQDGYKEMYDSRIKPE
ncbi:hypothetical protein HOLleu_25309 [Holothuria leucospilota]|uniref:Sulfotransferase family protein n=1 Tax=Holothuria leucospilota TaxID=206669 RepID=A0A9Q1BSU8_HOLLE|nr:hypothetical protein HOLleu_25309 [Holothuria leucospilota]